MGLLCIWSCRLRLVGHSINSCSKTIDILLTIHRYDLLQISDGIKMRHTTGLYFGASLPTTGQMSIRGLELRKRWHNQEKASIKVYLVWNNLDNTVIFKVFYFLNYLSVNNWTSIMFIKLFTLKWWWWWPLFFTWRRLSVHESNQWIIWLEDQSYRPSSRYTY